MLKLNDKLSLHFYTPVFSTVWDGPEVDDMNRGLKTIIDKKEQEGDSAIKSNVGGYQTSRELFDWPDPAIQAFKQRVFNEFSEVMKQTAPQAYLNKNYTVSGWANVLRDGSYNSLHNHPGSLWSGCYYVDAGDTPEDTADPSGTIEFVDPRTGIDMHDDGYWQNRYRIRPQTGQIVFFPSWLLHMVNAYHGSHDRISIAINLSSS